MNNLIYFLSAITVFFATQACSDASQNGNIPQPQLIMEANKSEATETMFNGDTLYFDSRFSRDKIAPSENSLPDFKATVSPNGLEISGYYLASYTGPELLGRMEVQNQNITIFIGDDGSDDGSFQISEGWFYDLTINNLQPKQYEVTIVHTSDLLTSSTADQEVAFTQTFNIQ